MEDAGSGIEGEVLVGADLGGGPAGLGVPFDREHVVYIAGALLEVFQASRR